MALSTALREVIFVMNLLHEFESNGLSIHKTTPKIACKTFEEYTTCLNIVT